MAYHTMGRREDAAYGVIDYIADFLTDIDTLPRWDAPGSKAYIIEDGSQYILDTSYHWQPYYGGGEVNPIDTIIYEGGDTPTGNEDATNVQIYDGGGISGW